MVMDWIPCYSEGNIKEVISTFSSPLSSYRLYYGVNAVGFGISNNKRIMVAKTHRVVNNVTEVIMYLQG
jgi:hypothetical protein